MRTFLMTRAAVAGAQIGRFHAHLYFVVNVAARFGLRRSSGAWKVVSSAAAVSRAMPTAHRQSGRLARISKSTA